ncbi:hypothetical protein [Arcanobacterium canis]
MSEAKPAVDPRIKLEMLETKSRDQQIADLEEIHRALSHELAKARI